MNGALLLGMALVAFGLGYAFYSKWIGKVFGVDPTRPTPAITKRDNIDYVPAHPMVLFGHHFAAIAGAGPIVGPVLAAQYGWLSVTLWIVLGCIFIGATHDMLAMLLSVRHDGESIGSVIGRILGPVGKTLFLIFSWAALVLVVAVFTSQIATTFVSSPAIATSSLLFIAEAIVFGICVYRLKMSVLWASLIFVPIMFAFVWIGTYIPIDLVKLLGVTPHTAMLLWCGILLVYCYFASTCPVWILLQPRDYLNAYLLYAMMALGILGVFISHPTLHMSAFTGFHAAGTGMPVFPILFVTVACGACSGFHALVASGTSSKQLDNEKNARPIAYGGMLMEGVLAMVAIIGVASAFGGQSEYLEGLKTTSAVEMFAGSVAGLCTKFGFPLAIAKGFILLSVSAFLMTSVDAGTRLARFSWQELMPKTPKFAWTRNMYLGTLVTCLVIAAFLMGDAKTQASLWTLFASANQLLASLTLLTITLWLIRNHKNYWIAAIPGAFMILVSGYALILKVQLGIRAANYLTAFTAAFLFILGVVVLVLGLKEIAKRHA